MLDLVERIERGKQAIASAKAQGKNVSSWEDHLAGLITERAYSLADTVNDAMGVPDGKVREVNRLGWAYLDLVAAGLSEAYWGPIREREVALLREIGQRDQSAKG